MDDFRIATADPPFTPSLATTIGLWRFIAGNDPKDSDFFDLLRVRLSFQLHESSELQSVLFLRISGRLGRWHGKHFSEDTRGG